MAIYDVNGNEIITDSSITADDVKRALISAVADGTVNLGAAVGATLPYSGLTDNWITNATTAYEAMKAQYDIDPTRSIPIFATADQHDAGLQCHRYMNNIDNEGVGFVSVNLGDTDNDTYGETAMKAWYDQIKQVKNYIGVVGNHDANLNPTSNDGITRWITRTFIPTNLPMYHAPSRLNSYVAIDGLHCVKYLVLDFEYIENESTKLGRGFDAPTVDWMIDWMTRNDGLDIVLLQHWPTNPTWKARGESEETAHNDPWSSGTAQPVQDLWNFFLARKFKQSGTYTDMDGGTHAYDFTGCETELLCELTGHQHEEKFTTKDGFTVYTETRHGVTSRACIFAVINRTTQKLHIYAFNSTEVLEELVLDI